MSDWRAGKNVIGARLHVCKGSRRDVKLRHGLRCGGQGWKCSASLLRCYAHEQAASARGNCAPIYTGTREWEVTAAN